MDINKYIDDNSASSDEESELHITLIVGAKFQTWEEFEVHLERYALQEGFSYKKTRVEYHLNSNEMKGLTVEQKKHEIKRRTYECTYSRDHISKKIVNLEDQRNREIHQINCPWRINVTHSKKKNSIGISSVKLEHNHNMNSLVNEIAPRFRKFTQQMLNDVEFYVRHGTTSATQIYPLLRAKFPDHPIFKKDLYNAIQKFKVGQKDTIKNDAVNLLYNLHDRKQQNPEWFFEFRLSEEDRRLTSLIWISPDQAYHYIRFHEVLIFDCTAGTNRHDMVLCLFLVVDNNTRSRLIASALLEDETESSFIWALQQLKKISNDIYPQIIYTDCDPAMASAISFVFPMTKHNLCIFHIDLNLKKNIKPKLGNERFNEFRSEFFLCRNSLVTEIFEEKWKGLISNFPEAAKYLQRMLDSTKESWASCYINKVFNCGINSTQRIESLNHLLKNTVQKNFLLCQLESEIQNLLDNEIKYERITKMHNSLPRQTLDDVPSKFFRHINEICKDFLTPQILAATQTQMKHSFFYDAYLIDGNFIQQADNMDYSEGFREDDYEVSQTLLQFMIRNIQNTTISEIWEVKPELSQTKSHFVILMADGSHSCTCNLLISFGIPCRHFYKVLRKSPQAKFHILLINQRWYHDSKLSITNEELASLNAVSIVEDNSTVTVREGINFDYIHQIRGGKVYTENLQNIVSFKAKYGKSLGIARKALDLAQKLDCYNELNGMLQSFIDEKQLKLLQEFQTIDKENIEYNQGDKEFTIICSNPVTSRRRGRPPNRYMSEGETARQSKKHKTTNLALERIAENNETNGGNNKKLRKCKGCQGIGHDLRNCKSKVLGEIN